ncbi:hypothetical protein [Aliiroseovarius crassostreae]|uniref:hypothetical protein n=1 Tax=Aliiroseovarius crassostreae TaxID=154981 RepID=UPI003C7DFD46
MYVTAVILQNNVEIQRIKLEVTKDGIETAPLQAEMNRIRKEGVEVFDSISATFISSLEE